jgi:hypothetical protein
MRIVAFESPLIAKANQRVHGSLVWRKFPEGDLALHKQWDLQDAYLTSEGAHSSSEGRVDPQGASALNTPLQSWGIAQIELDYPEDLVLAYQSETSSTHCYALPAIAYNAPYCAPCPVFNTLAALLAYVRCYFTIDTQLYWGKTSQGYGGIALHALVEPTPAGDGPSPVPFLPMFDLHLAQPYSLLSSQLMEAAGTEWALRTLPESISDGIKDPRPLVTLGAQPYYQQAVSRALLKTSRWANTARANKQAEKGTRSVWETFLVPHQQLAGYVQQWQEILFRFLPLYCQWSERLAQQSEALQKKQILTPYFERSVTPMGRLAQEMESLRGLAQARLIQQTQQTQQKTPPSEPSTLSPRELLRSREFSQRWQLFLNDYGHCGVLDLAQPRMHEQQEQWLSTLLSPWCEGRPLSELSWSQRAWAGVLWKDYAQLYSLREKLWSDTLWALDQVKRRMLLKLQEASASGQLPEWTFHELCHQSLDTLTGEAKPSQTEALAPPPTDLLTAGDSDRDSELETLQGVGLQTGLAQGLLWYAEASSTRLPAGYLPTKTILCLPEVSALHLPLIQQVAGVLVMHGNPWSQGSHLLREWNKPAIVQIRDISQLPDGTPVRLNSETGVVDVLETLP